MYWSQRNCPEEKPDISNSKSSDHFSLRCLGRRPCAPFCKMGELSALFPTPKLVDHPLSSVHGLDVRMSGGFLYPQPEDALRCGNAEST